MINQSILNDHAARLRAKYKNKIHEISLEYCTDNQGEYINWNVLRNFKHCSMQMWERQALLNLEFSKVIISKLKNP